MEEGGGQQQENKANCGKFDAGKEQTYPKENERGKWDEEWGRSGTVG